jgi:hypothetical protein
MPVGIGLGVAGLGSAAIARNSAKDASKASLEAAGIQAGSEAEALEYLKQSNALPMQLRDQALQGLAGYYQVPGAPKTQEQLMAETYASPLYKGLLSTTDAAVDQVARYQSASGGLRSGNAQMAYAREGQRVSWDAFNTAYNNAQSNDQYERALNLQGLSGLAGLQTGETGIADLTARIGETRGQGMIGAAQAKQQGTQNAMGNLFGVAGLGLQAYGNGMIKI